MKARKIEVIGGWRIGGSVVYVRSKLIRLGKLAQRTTYKWQDGKMLGIYSFSLTDLVFGKTVIEVSWQL